MESEIMHVMVALLIGSAFGAGLYEYFVFRKVVFLLCAAALILLYFSIYRFLLLLLSVYRADKAIAQAQSAVGAIRIYNERLLPLLREELPKTLFRYVALVESKAQNELRFRSLANDTVWLTRADCQNDPFEGFDLHYSQEGRFDEVLAAYSDFETRKSSLEAYFEAERKNFILSCFTDRGFDPTMWAHYANGHRGFCLVYEVVSPDVLYPVRYAKKKIEVGPTLERLQKEFVRGDIAHPEYVRALEEYHRAWCASKNISWSWERETRVVLSRKIAPYAGINVASSELGLRLKGIYLGYYCAPQNKRRLYQIATSLGIFCHEVEPDRSGEIAVMKLRTEDTEIFAEELPKLQHGVEKMQEKIDEIRFRHFARETDEDLLKRYYAPKLSSEEIGTMIDAWNTLNFRGKYFEMFAALCEETVVGTVSLYEHAPSIVSIGIAIFPPYRSRGAGTRAMELALEHCREKGYKIVCQQVQCNNTASIRMHCKTGFETDQYPYRNQIGQEIFLFLRPL